MPIYEYEAVGPSTCPKCSQRFEVVQRLSDASLSVCPVCGAPVQKVFSAPAIQGACRSGDMLSNKNLAEKGFTKYVKAGDGHYEKQAGKGPDVIKR
jgi:putative FmdB family regulatory protein